jgi:hypothetical protein
MLTDTDEASEGYSSDVADIVDVHPPPLSVFRRRHVTRHHPAGFRLRCHVKHGRFDGEHRHRRQALRARRRERYRQRTIGDLQGRPQAHGQDRCRSATHTTSNHQAQPHLIDDTCDRNRDANYPGDDGHGSSESANESSEHANDSDARGGYDGDSDTAHHTDARNGCNDSYARDGDCGRGSNDSGTHYAGRRRQRA